MFSVENLKHYYKDIDGNEVHALDGVSLEIADGEFVAVIGANGSGKSTFINSYVGKKSTKTGDRPGVTKGKQCVSGHVGEGGGNCSADRGSIAGFF